MNNPDDKIETETVKFKIIPIEKKDKNLTLCHILSLIALIMCIIYTFLLINKKVKDRYLFKLQEKDNIIETLKEKLNNINSHFIEGKKNEADKEQKTEKEASIEKEYLYDKNFYISYRMKGFKDNKGNGNGYHIILKSHTLEKGFSHFNLRPFGQKKIKIIINLLKKQINFNNYENLFSFIIGINSLREYKKIYEEHKWTDKLEYKEVSEFLIKYTKIKEQKTGAYILTKEELKSDYNIDYRKFIKSRHSTRNYKNMTLKIEDIKEAIDMAKYSASACNRQYIKVHYYPKGKMRQNIIDYSIGKGGLYLEGVNTFIVTFDTNALTGAGERNQGYFNAGLFSTNFVNALHSLGIGTCFIEFSNSVEEEEKLKEINKIPSNERIAVILYAGYYDEKSIFCMSPRKDVEEYFKLHD
jgi:nitroreductase